MPKTTVKTYSKRDARRPQTAWDLEFDDVVRGSQTSKAAQCSPGSALPKRSVWLRTNRTVSKGATESPGKSNPPCRESKRPKIEENDPFAFDEDECDVTGNHRELKSRGDRTEKSTDDECSSSQELSGSPSGSADRPRKRRASKKLVSRSPFKSFLKNNNLSLSPVKMETGTHSATASSADLSDEPKEPERNAESHASAKRSIFKRLKSREGKVMVKRNDKPLFTVVQNVKAVHECVESGEDQQFFDDIEYALDGMHEKRSLTTRCMSTLELASQCTQPTFRLNLRAHGLVPRIFNVLHDAPSDTCLALCTSAVMLMLTQDQQNADFDQFVLELMMKLLSADGPDENCRKDYDKYAAKIKTLLSKKNTLSRLADGGDVNASSLARESILSFTSQKASGWFKEQVRILGGLDHVIDTITSAVENLTSISDPKAAGKITQISRCLKLLEIDKKVQSFVKNGSQTPMTFQNTGNQTHVIRFHKGVLISAISRLLISFVEGIKKSTSKRYAVQDIRDDCLLDLLKVLLNVTHDLESGSTMVGQQKGLLEALLACVLQLPQVFNKEKKFDLLVLGLGLLINLLEHSKQNIESLLEIRTPPCQEWRTAQELGPSQNARTSADTEVPAVQALMQLFTVREKVARNTEDMTSGLSTEDESSQELRPTKDGLGWEGGDYMDATLDNDEMNEAAADSQDGKSLDEEIGKALQKAGKHMEDSVVAAYVALLMGCVVQGNKANKELIRDLLPEGDFSIFVEVLRKFLGFIKLTSGTSGQAIERIVQVFEQQC